MTLPVRSPAPEESLDGFLRRLAEQEFWPDVYDFLAGLGLRYGRRMLEDAAKAEELLELEPGTLASISPSASPSNPSRSWRFERHHSAPVCPDCLAGGAPHHQSWRHAFVTCCVDHGIRLVDKCPMCQESYRPGRGGYDSCHCGCPLDGHLWREFHIEQAQLSPRYFVENDIVALNPFRPDMKERYHHGLGQRRFGLIALELAPHLEAVRPVAAERETEVPAPIGLGVGGDDGARA